MSTGYFGKRELLYLDNLFWGLITSSHILHKHGIFDAYGHVSVRSPDNPSTFFMPSNMAPALLKSADDLVEYKVEDASPAGDTQKSGYVERYIHSEMYKKFPTVNAVVHSHCRDVLPYCINDVPLKPAIHMAGFLGPGDCPIWDIQSAYSMGEKQQDLLVRNTSQGHSLAVAFKPESSGQFIYSKMKSALTSQLGASSSSEASPEPHYRVVLMRGHGFTSCADSLEAVVFQSIYTKEAASVQTLGLLTMNAYSDALVEGNVDVDNSGKIKGGKVKAVKSLKYLSDREAQDAWQMNKFTMTRPWGLWVREVEVDPLYQNEVKKDLKPFES